LADVKYLAIIEREAESWGAYVPDLPGCVAVASSRDRAEVLIREAVVAHVELLRERGEAVPKPSSEGLVVDAT
jgi:predicted RNase H-like HicB family nuclease